MVISYFPPPTSQPLPTLYGMQDMKELETPLSAQNLEWNLHKGSPDKTDLEDQQSHGSHAAVSRKFHPGTKLFHSGCLGDKLR